MHCNPSGPNSGRLTSSDTKGTARCIPLSTFDFTPFHVDFYEERAAVGIEKVLHRDSFHNLILLELYAFAETVRVALQSVYPLGV